jgi:hypothetical protein
MWRTSRGKRTLEGAEATVFAEALRSLLDEAVLGYLEEYDVGVNAFDRLTYGQKISVLATVGSGLLRTDTPCVELTAVLEAGIATVFEHLMNCIMLEIDMPSLGTTWRQRVIAARGETGGKDLPPVTCKDPDQWDIEVQSLADCILWDADYEDEALYLDASPEEAEWLKSMTRIPDNYYTAIADDLKDHEIEEKLAELKNLCRSVISCS